MFKHVLLLLGLGVFCAGAALAAGESVSDPLAKGFASPPSAARPQAWWWWLRTPTTRECITRDLEEMKAKGLSGCLLMDCGVRNFAGKKWDLKTVIGETEIRYEPTKEFKQGYLAPLPQWVPVWTPPWREMVRFAAKEAGRLGLDFGVFLGPAGCGAPWVTPEYGQQALIWSEKAVSGPARVSVRLPLGKKARKQEQASDYHRDVAVLALPARETVRPEEVIDLTAKMDATGRLTWDAPAGKWTILRFSQVATGARKEDLIFIDHLSAEAFDMHWAKTMGLLLKEMTPEERKGLHYVECDSWEAGTATWTKKFPEEFARRRGYGILPYMPVLAGKTLESAERSARFRRDYDLTISDLIAENHYGRQKAVANAAGLRSYAEAAGPHQFQADVLKSTGRCDIAMGEFWMPSPHRPTPPQRFLLRDAAAAAHIYGLRRVFAEAFTSVGPDWEESPFLMKSTADQAFCDGLNWICFHSFSHSPSLTAKPGFDHSAGTHFDPNITWWDQSPAFVNYLARCSYLLQEGLFAADVVFYQGDDIGKFAVMKNPPPTLGAGYDYDQCNTEVLLMRMSVKDGKLVLPDGMSYRVLVLPEREPLTTQVLRKLAELVAAGATVIGAPPAGPAGLKEDPAEFRRIAKRLWGGLDGTSRTEQRIGQGRIVWGKSVRAVLQEGGAAPDFECRGVSAKGVIDWIHRTAGDTQIYFVASRWQPEERLECTFRVSGRQPELWDPVTGKIRAAAAYWQEGGRTVVPLEFAPCGSVFVIFRKAAQGRSAEGGARKSNFPEMKKIAEIAGPWEVRFDPKWGGPEKATFERLTDWTQRPEDGIKYYSGKATYKKTFDLGHLTLNQSHISNFRPQIFLDLGSVLELAAVRLNGRDLGVLWTRPFRVEITGALKPSGNELEIDVVNLWPNRLIGDEFLPEEKRYTKTNIHKFTTASALRPSGLLGPVRLLETVPGE